MYAYEELPSDLRTCATEVYWEEEEETYLYVVVEWDPIEGFVEGWHELDGVEG